MASVAAAPRYAALAALGAGIFIAALDQTVVVTVLPDIMVDMRLGITDLDRASWTVTGYLLGYSAAMPLMGRMSDAFGHRRLYLLGLLLFALGSVAVALAQSLPWLIGARVFQAIGGGMVLPVAIALSTQLFPVRQRAPVLGIIGAAAEAGGVLGPLWGGAIVRLLEWRWVFWINLPICVGVALLVLLLCPPGQRHAARIDYLGGLLLAGSLALLTLGLGTAGAGGWQTGAALVGAVALFGAFLLREVRASSPILPLGMFRGVAFSAANVTHLLMGAALIMAMVNVPMITDTVMGQSPLEGGLRLMRLTAAIPVGAVLGGFLARWLGYRPPTLAGLALIALGFSLFSGWDPGLRDPWMTLHLVTGGLGFGLVIAPLATAVVNGVADGLKATAASLFTVMRMVGMTLGLAGLSTWGTGRFQELVAGVRLTPQGSETLLEAQVRFQEEVTEAGGTLFQEFFLAGMVICLLALLPALFLRRERGE